MARNRINILVSYFLLSSQHPPMQVPSPCVPSPCPHVIDEEMEDSADSAKLLTEPTQD